MNDLPDCCKAVLRHCESRTEFKYRMRWKGSKISRGSTIGGVPIAWTQNGVVTLENGETAGTYTRTKEFGGDANDEHEIIISLTEQAEAISPDGSNCREVGNDVISLTEHQDSSNGESVQG